MRACATASVLALAALAAASGLAQETERVLAPRLERTAEGTLAVSASLVGFFDDHRERFFDGMRHVIDAHLDAIDPASGRSVASHRRRCAVAYDAWHDAFRVDLLLPVSESHGHLEPARMEIVCLEIDRALLTAIGELPDEVRIEAVVELDPPTSELIHGVRAWLVRPDGADALLPDFFGSIAAIFVSRTVLVEPRARWRAVSPPIAVGDAVR